MQKGLCRSTGKTALSEEVEQVLRQHCDAIVRHTSSSHSIAWQCKGGLSEQELPIVLWLLVSLWSFNGWHGSFPFECQQEEKHRGSRNIFTPGASVSDKNPVFMELGIM